MTDVAFKLLLGGIIFLFFEYQIYIISRLTDFPASNDVSMSFQGYVEGETQCFLISKFHP